MDAVNTYSLFGDDAGAHCRTLADIAAGVADCDRCRLCSTRTNTVPGEGLAERPDVMFVGEGPGAEEDATGRPFVGRAGQLLTKMIAAMGYTREQVYIANIVKCRPPNNRVPEPDEMAACMPWLKKQIALIRPRCIVTLGATALKGMTGLAAVGITREHGTWRKFGEIPMLATFHPSYLLRSPNVKKDAWEDLKAVLRFLGKDVPARSHSGSVQK